MTAWLGYGPLGPPGGGYGYGGLVLGVGPFNVSPYYGFKYSRNEPAVQKLSRTQVRSSE